MEQPEKKFSATLTTGILASAIFHAVLLYVLIFGFPQWRMEAGGPEAIQVQLVHADDTLPAEEEPGGPEDEAPITEEEEQSAEEEIQTAEQEQQATEVEPEVTEEEHNSGAEVETAGEVEMPLPTLSPVYQFGEETEGPEQSDVGEELSDTEVAEAQTSEAPPEESETPETVISALSAPSGDTLVLPETEEATEEPEETAESLLSLHNNDGSVATTAVEDTTRRNRAAVLCASELQRELFASPWPPQIIPRYTLDKGTVLEETQAAFRSKGQWYNLQFRCEIDEGATRVTAFEYEVGAPIPQEEWASRGFPN